MLRAERFAELFLTSEMYVPKRVFRASGYLWPGNAICAPLSVTWGRAGIRKTGTPSRYPKMLANFSAFGFWVFCFGKKQPRLSICKF
jgi:hypothetical protein